MLKINVAIVVLIMDNLRLSGDTANKQLGAEVDDEYKEKYPDYLNDALIYCQRMNLQFSAAYVERIIERFKAKPSHDLISKETQIIIDRMLDELNSHLFLQVPSSHAKFYDDVPQFGQEVADKFPKVVADIQEAGKCFASERYTASVFHLMRVMESSTQYLGKRLSINLVGEKNWHNILDEVDKAIKNLPIKTARQKALRNKFAAASAHLRMVKDAWRNDVMHPKETYTEEEAERVFRNVKDFMVHLATKL